MMATQRYKVPSTNALVSRILLELLALSLLGYPMLHIYVFLQGDAEPYQRGFYCDDQDLKHPIIEEEISVGNCVLIWICIVLFFVPLVELLHFGVYKYKDWEDQIKEQQGNEKWHCLTKIPLVIVELYRMLGYFFIGALGALLTTEMAKYKIGRLRPYFLTVCNIDLTDDLCKKDGYNIFVMNYNCTPSGENGAFEVREARKSFLSGHSSFSFYCATFLIIYLQARLSRKRAHSCEKREGSRCCVLMLRLLKVWRPFLQFGFFGLALYIAFTRISDYKHHPTDIIAGVIVGVIFALIILLFLVDLFRRPRSFEEKMDEYDFLGIQLENLGLPGSPNARICVRRGDVESNGTSVNEIDHAKGGLAPLARIEDLAPPSRGARKTSGKRKSCPQ